MQSAEENHNPRKHTSQIRENRIMVHSVTFLPGSCFEKLGYRVGQSRNMGRRAFDRVHPLLYLKNITNSLGDQQGPNTRRRYNIQDFSRLFLISIQYCFRRIKSVKNSEVIISFTLVTWSKHNNNVKTNIWSICTMDEYLRLSSQISWNFALHID